MAIGKTYVLTLSKHLYARFTCALIILLPHLRHDESGTFKTLQWIKAVGRNQKHFCLYFKTEFVLKCFLYPVVIAGKHGKYFLIKHYK